MKNLNALFYKEDDHYGILKISKFGKISSSKMKGNLLKNYLEKEKSFYLKCTGKFLLSIKCVELGKCIYREYSKNNEIVVNIDNSILFIDNNYQYYFEIIALEKNISINIETLENHQPIERYKLTSVAFPTSCFPETVNDLFYKGDAICINESGKNKVLLNQTYNCSIDFNTYFNSIELDKWKKHTNCEKIYFKFCLKGEIIVRVKEVTLDQIVCSQVYRIKSLNFKDIYVDLSSNKSNIVGVQIDAIQESEIIDPCYECTCRRKNDYNNLAIVITAYNEPKALVNALNLASELNVNVPELPYHIFLIDNSSSIDIKKSNNNITIIHNANLGGTGGFIRGWLESKKNGYSLCMFMDDDAFTSPFSIEKAFKFLDFAKNRNLSISGAMLDKNDMLMQLENGAYFNAGCHPINCNLNVSDPRTFVINNVLEPEMKRKIYGSWWFFMFRNSEYITPPYPFFVRGDDIDFSYKNKFDIELLNGCCAWQESFVRKENVTSVFLFIRSHLIHHITLEINGDPLDSINKIIDNHVIRYLKQFRYDLAEAVFLSLDFVLKGSKEWEKKILLGPILSSVKTRANSMSTERLLSENKISKTYDFYKRLRLWPITRIVKKYTMNSLLVPSFLKSHKIWVIQRQNYVEPSFLFMKDRYALKDNEGVLHLFKYSYGKTIRAIILLTVYKIKIKLKFNFIKNDYNNSYIMWSDESKWYNVFEKLNNKTFSGL